MTEEEVKTLGEGVAVKAVAFYPRVARLALYSNVTDEDVDLAIKKIQFVVTKLAAL